MLEDDKAAYWDRHLRDAVMSNRADSAKIYLEKGADPNQHAENQNLTLLHQAVLKDNTGELVKLLLLHGAKVDAPDHQNGLTAAMYAAQKNITALVILLMNGASLEIKTRSGSTLMDFARQVKNEAAIKVIEQREKEIKEEKRLACRNVSATSQTSFLSARQRTTVRARPTC